ncbi:uncharacterized protein si:ch211-223a10.1 isoform X1 [Erpetoichthys calabaricus]|uniref:uncharacterized protein si:ch211-223a10.1 isoform X1 n=1 Tax=Erpetoichthys calabaricus TaxID=27687 RepID=UPI0010A00475|nr:uncharacterized protein si:ch211-223a10.1 isoform X1 [Erpetoichthys calabaricus]
MTETSSPAKPDVFQSIQKGDVERCEILIRHNPSVLTLKGWSGFTPLHYATFQGSKVLVNILLQFGADPNLPDDAGQTPFHFACRRGDVHIIHQMMKHGANVNLTDHHWKTALHHAVSGGNLCAIRYLEDMGIFSYCDTDKFLLTPLHLAASMGNTDVVQYLLRNGRCVIDAVDYQGMTPMHVAAERGAVEVCCLLLQAGESQILYKKDKNGLNPLELAKLGTTFRHQQLAKILEEYKTEAQNGKMNKSYGMYCWTLMFPAVSGALVLLVSSALGKYGAACGTLFFILLARMIFFQYHRINGIQRTPNPVYLGAFCAGIFHTLVCFYCKIMLSLWPRHILIVLSSTHFFVTVWTFKLLLTKNPGQLQRVDTKISKIMDLIEANKNLSVFCIYCEIFQPERTKHCKLCSVCVEDYDHHCLFLHNCIGRDNHRIFIIFILELAVSHMIFIFSSLYYFYLSYDLDAWNLLITAFTSEVWLVGMSVMNFITLFWECWLLQEQFAVISEGNTMYFRSGHMIKHTWMQKVKTFLIFLVDGKKTSELHQVASGII